ncbi:MAG TPA: membrane protein insertase YidC [Treponemataceae bacterium]|nr:membrane protein insertase YidC [Treponemataceae bacterium]
MDKNTVIAIFLSTIVIIGGFTLQNILFPPQPVVHNTQETAVSVETYQNSAAENKQSKEAVLLSLPDTEQNTEENFTVETDLVQVTFTNKGGDILSYKLKKHTDKTDFVEMADFVTDSNRAFSVLLGNENSNSVNEIFNTRIISDTVIGFYKNFQVQNTDGSFSSFTLVKQYSFIPDDYMFELKITIDGDDSFTGLNIAGSAYTLRTSPQIGPTWNQKQDRYEYRKFYYLTEGQKKTVTLKEGQIKKITDPSTWTAVAGKYFTLISLPDTQLQSSVFSSVSGQADTTSAQMFLTRGPITGNSQTDTWKFYIGPRTEKNLVKYNIITNNPYKLYDTKLDQVVEGSGPLGPLEVLLKKLMELFYKIIPNWGVSIIIMTILLRAVIFPLTKKSSESTLKMQELQPKIKEIQDKYKNNQQKMNEEMAKFYQTAGYNPLSGCLPLLIQFPLIFAMYNLFNNYFEFRGAMFIPGWIPDLSQGDSVFSLSSPIPLLGWTDIRLLPVIYVVSQLLFGKVTQTPGAAQQNSSMKFMMYGMPLMFFFMFYNAPAGLLVYWIFSNVLTLIQQVVINKMMHAKKKENLKLVTK